MKNKTIYLKNGKDANYNSIELIIINDMIMRVNTKIAKEEIESIQRENGNLEIIDLTGKIIMPGVIDIHTHMREPGITQKEDFYTGSRACAKAGITTFFDMPNTLPTTTTLEALIEKKQLAKEKSIVNYGFHFGGSKNDNIEEIKKVLSSKEANTVKIFMNVTTGEMLIEDDDILQRIFENSGLVLVHAENEMIDKAVMLNKNYGHGLYICHIPSKAELEKAINAKNDKTLNTEEHPIYTEVTPHHLFLNETIRESNESNKMLLRMKPELRTEKDNEFLWKSLINGDIDTIGTDHAPHLLEEKLEKVTFGMPGVETSLALMLDAVNKGRITLPKVQQLMCENPAKIMQLEKKGKLEEGYIADIIAVDMEKEWIVGVDDILESKCNWSPYKDWKLKGKNILTIVNGKVVYENGEFFE